MLRMIGVALPDHGTGYFTSRPSTKLYSRVASGVLRAARQVRRSLKIPADFVCIFPYRHLALAMMGTSECSL